MDRYQRGDGRRYHELYATWANMIYRCENPDNPRYDSYGGRGITVCDRWQVFANFAADMGERPVGHTLDRIDLDKGYYKENCRWATPEQQARNTSRNVWITFRGERMVFTDAVRLLGISVRPYYLRLKNHKETPQQAIDYLSIKYGMD